MLYRFREAQAAELGLGTRADRRPRMASSCKSLRECERWRGEILREISRKVSKIQDSGLSDYETRDLNDEINKLVREKRHWENQIVALGGANYRRNVAMLDDDGKEVPGTKGYKYFGRAKDLPGVREMFQSRKKEEEEDNLALAHYKKFMGNGPAYFGDLDEQDADLLKFERELEEENWEEAYTNLRAALGLSTDEPVPPFPREEHPLPPSHPSEKTSESKRKSRGDDVEPAVLAQSDVDPSAKRQRTSSSVAQATSSISHAQQAASFIPFLSPEDLIPPKLPSHEEMEGVLLALRKRALMEEYFGETGSVEAVT